MLRVGVAVVLAVAAGGCDRFLQLQELPQPPPPDAPPLPSSWTSVSGGYYHTCGIREDQTLWCWGRNDRGQLGTPAAAFGESDRPVQIGTDTWSTVSAAEHHACGVRTDHSLACWGNNGDGALGTGKYDTITGLSPIAGTSWATVASGLTFACAIDMAGQMQCWGNNFRGELGNLSTTGPSVPVAVSGGPWASVAAGGQHACAIDTSGHLWCWGENGLGETAGITNPSPVTEVSTSETFTKVAVGNEFACALTTTGHLRCFGHNSNGQLGNGNRNGGPALQPVGNDSATWVDIAAGYAHACARDQDGGLWCWGDNEFGQLATTTVGFDFSTLPVKVSGGAGAWSAIGLGADHTCAIANSDRVMWCAGLGGGGQTATLGAHTSPTQIGGTWTTIAPGSEITCAIDAAKHMSCWGDNGVGGVGDGTNTPRQTPTAVSGNQMWSGVAVGDHVCAIDTGSVAYCWGENILMELGDGTQTDRNVPTQTSLGTTPLAQVATENDTTCVLQGSTPICWGDNYWGECGTSGTPLGPTSVGIAVTAIVIGDDMTCALPTTGGVSCWGYGDSLGDGLGTSRSNPGPVSGLSGTFDQLVAGDDHTCARAGTRLWCWGVNYYGQIGNQDVGVAGTPFEHTGRTWTAVGVGGNHTCAIEAPGRLYCWGANDSGQVGDGTTVDRGQPTPIGSDTDWASVVLGRSHTCAFKTDGSLWCWGANVHGELGDGTAWRSDLQIISE